MKKIFNILTVLAVTGFIVLPTAAADPSHKSSSSPIWTFVAPPPEGSTKLVRTPNGITAQFQTTGLTAGHAVTLWIMFFDNPDACANPGACVPGVYPVGDIGAPGVRFDFHYAAGHIVNGAKTTLAGHLQTGELSTSGWAELVEIGGAPPAWVTALTNPLGAQVILAIHSHGPAQTGGTLVEQMSSYLGGCVLPFLGDPGGFAQSADDIPAAPGECSTIQLAFHNP
jgi:hypothetical protein